jgi:septin 7
MLPCPSGPISGVAEVDNAAHCDSAMLQKMLTETHLHDLKGVTEVHYEMFRKKVLEKSGIGPDASPTFTSTRGRTAENELQKKHEDMKRDLEEQARSLEEKRRQFEEERKLYDEAKRRTSATSNSSATN